VTPTAESSTNEVVEEPASIAVIAEPECTVSPAANAETERRPSEERTSKSETPEDLSPSTVPPPDIETLSQPSSVSAETATPIEVYGDASYGTGEILAELEGLATPHLKVQHPASRDGLFSKACFQIDLSNETVTCPNGALVQIRRTKSGDGFADFGPVCGTCPLREKCTTSKSGRTIRIHKHERLLQRERTRQKDPTWRAQYKATRPKVERKFGHMMRRRHGGRRARVRGTIRVGQDFALLAAATNIQRIAVLRAREAAKAAA
jgi:hypothetical protein